MIKILHVQGLLERSFYCVGLFVCVINLINSSNNFSYMPGEVEIELAGRQNHKYEKFLNDIYTCIKERQFGPKRSCTPDSEALFNRRSGKESGIGLSTIDEHTSDSRPARGSTTGKGTKFKNFLSALDEQQKKVSMNNMNLLGLEVKKMNYCEKERRKMSKNYLDRFEENANSSTRGDEKSLSKSQIKRINCQATEQFSCKQMGVSLQEIHHKPILSKRHSFRTKEKPKSSKSQFKKRIAPEIQNPVYQNRINSYKDLIFKVQFAHGFYIQTEKDLDENFSMRNQKKYKAWVGLGNNGNLIKGLLKRRFWWTVLDEKSLNVNFIWTQLRNMDFMQKQTPSNLWARDTSKVWGQDCLMISSKLTAQRKKRKNFFQEQKQEDFSHKILINQEKEKLEELQIRLKDKVYRQKQSVLQLPELDSSDCKMHNHLSNNFFLGNKKALFYNLKQYYELQGENVFTRLPLTFHIKKGFKDIQYKRFLAFYKRRQATMKKLEKEQGEGKKKKMRNVWIVKPGELTNRGNGITVIDEVYQLNHIMKQEAEHQNGTEKTFIVQLYIDRPLLYQKRKFDIRHYILITHINGLMRAYWFQEGYIRTSSYQFNIENFEREIHLTNDAIQKCSAAYGKYQPANKLSYADFQRYLDVTYPKRKYNFQRQILPQMKQISLDAVKSSYLKLSPKRLKHNFEIFGLDFMIDESFKPWLIEINTNPCLEICCPLLARIIPQMVDQALRLSLDIVFPPPCHYPNTCKHLAPEANLESLEFQLMFDEKRDGRALRELYKTSNQNLLEQIGQISQEETYQDDGKDIILEQFL